MNFKRLSLTDIKIDIPRIPKKKSLVAAMEAAGKISYKKHEQSNLYCSYNWGDGDENYGGRCEEQVGQQLLGEEADCSEEESFLE